MVRSAAGTAGAADREPPAAAGRTAGRDAAGGAPRHAPQPSARDDPSPWSRSASRRRAAPRHRRRPCRSAPTVRNVRPPADLEALTAGLAAARRRPAEHCAPATRTAIAPPTPAATRQSRRARALPTWRRCRRARGFARRRSAARASMRRQTLRTAAASGAGGRTRRPALRSGWRPRRGNARFLGGHRRSNGQGLRCGGPTDGLAVRPPTANGLLA